MILALIEPVGRDAPGGLDAILGVALGALVVGLLWWRALAGQARHDPIELGDRLTLRPRRFVRAGDRHEALGDPEPVPPERGEGVEQDDPLEARL